MNCIKKKRKLILVVQHMDSPSLSMANCTNGNILQETYKYPAHGALNHIKLCSDKGENKSQTYVCALGNSHINSFWRSHTMETKTNKQGNPAAKEESRRKDAVK